MTDLMRLLYNHATDSLAPGLVDQKVFRRETRRSERLREKLLKVLSEEDQKLFWNYQDTMSDLTGMEQEALFRAAFRMARELG